MARNKTSKAWINQHVNDHWVQEATRRGYRSRAAYKLLEMLEKDDLLKAGQRVVDLGSAPGSWSQVAADKVGPSGKVIALDILPMDAIGNVHFIQGDFREDGVLKALESTLNGAKIDLVICDIAPNLTGSRVTDQARSYYLNELALDFCGNWLKPGGHFLVKVFQGEGYTEYFAAMRLVFDQVLTRKPKASRDDSRELYLFGRGRRHTMNHMG